MIDDYFFSSYFKKISVPTPTHCFDTAHIIALVPRIPRRNTQNPLCLKACFLLGSQHPSFLFNRDAVTLGFNPPFATRLSEQDSSKDDMDLSSHALKPDWWECGFQERFCDRNPDVAPFPQRPHTPFYT